MKRDRLRSEEESKLKQGWKMGGRNGGEREGEIEGEREGERGEREERVRRKQGDSQDTTHWLVSEEMHPHSMNWTLSELLSTVQARLRLGSSCLQLSKSSVVGRTPDPGSVGFESY